MSAKEETANGPEGIDAKQIAAKVLQDPEALALMQSKLAGMVGTLSGYYDTLPAVVKRRVKALKRLQVQALEVEAKMAAEIHELECRYAALFEPIHLKRADIVSGAHEPTDEEADFPSDEEEEDAEDEADGADDGENGGADGGSSKKLDDESAAKKKKDTDSADDQEMGDADNKKSSSSSTHGFDENTKGIPEFWLTTFKNVELIGENIQEHDEPILSHLTDLRVKNSLKPKGFTLEFHFSPNEYFTNSLLTKYYELKCEVDPEDPFSFEGAEISKCKGCDISWKKGKNVTVRQVTKKQKHKTKGTTRSVTKQVQNDSFFNFFSPPTPAENEEEMDDEQHAILAADFEIGEVMRQRLVQRAVLYFTGEALDEDYEDEEEDEEDEDDMDDEDEDSDNDEDFDPTAAVAAAAAAAKQCKAKGGKGKNPEECKQQ